MPPPTPPPPPPPLGLTSQLESGLSESCTHIAVASGVPTAGETYGGRQASSCARRAGFSDPAGVPGATAREGRAAVKAGRLRMIQFFPPQFFTFFHKNHFFPISATTALTKTLTKLSSRVGHTLHAAARFMTYPKL